MRKRKKNRRVADNVSLLILAAVAAEIVLAGLVGEELDFVADELRGRSQLGWAAARCCSNMA